MFARLRIKELNPDSASKGSSNKLIELLGIFPTQLHAVVTKFLAEFMKVSIQCTKIIL